MSTPIDRLPQISPQQEAAAREFALNQPPPVSGNRADYPSDEAFLLAHPGGVQTEGADLRTPQIAAPPGTATAAPAAVTSGEGPQVLEPLPADTTQQPIAPQYHVEQVQGASSSTSGSSGIDQRDVKHIRDAHEQLRSAQNAGIEAAKPQIERDTKAATEVAALAQQRAALSAKAAVDAANERDRIAVDNKAARDKLDQDANDYLQAGDKIDSGRVWHRMDTGQKIAFAIGAALSGFAQGLNGRGGNPVLEMLTAAQERDLRAQEIGLQAKGRGLQMRESMYSRLVEAGHDKEVARAKTLVDSDNAIVQQIAAAQAAAKTPTAAEAAAALYADMQAKQAQDTVALEQSVARHTTSSSTRTVQPMLVDQNGKPYDPKGPTKEDETHTTVEALTSIPGVKKKNNALAENAIRNRSLQKVMHDQLAGVQQVHESAYDMTKASEETGTTFFGGITDKGAEGNSKFEMAKQGFVAGVRNALGESATDQTNKMLEQLVHVSLDDWRQARTRAMIKGLTSQATREVNARYAATGLGFDEADWNARRDASGGGAIVRQVQ